MKKQLLLFFSFIFSLSYSQNLVPNPSFELYDTCPNTSNEGIESAIDWYNPTSYSPDYYNACATDTLYGQNVPKNGFGFQMAKTGVAYAGIILHISTDAREYIQVELIDTLRVGKKYYVKFYVAIADSSPYATHNIGVYFSSLPIQSSQSLFLPYQPQIENNPQVNPLNVANTWIEVADSFIANGGEHYITIGNFRNDLNTDTVNMNNGTNWTSFSYYYIDDISVILLDTLTNISSSFIEVTAIEIYPNPTSSIFSVKSKNEIKKIEIYDYLGRLVYKNSSNLNNIDMSEKKAGVYFIIINDERTEIKKIIKF